MNALRSLESGIGDESPVEGRKPSAVHFCQTEEIAVGYLTSRQQTRNVEYMRIHKTDVIGPEMMLAQRPQRSQRR